MCELYIYGDDEEYSAKFHPGDKIYHLKEKKNGIIKYLMNDIREKNRRKKNPNHYYYRIKWEDNSIDIIHQDEINLIKKN